MVWLIVELKWNLFHALSLSLYKKIDDANNGWKENIICKSKNIGTALKTPMVAIQWPLHGSCVQN